ncbi:MAG: hypothetical protein ABIQ30_01680 [Devosia sp.]
MWRAALGLLISIAAVPAAAQSAVDAGLDDFVTICPGIALSPKDASGLTAEAGLNAVTKTIDTPSYVATEYRSQDGKRVISVGIYVYPDALRISCSAYGPSRMTRDALSVVVSRLEENELVGRLDGTIVSLGQAFAAAYYKREGNDPLLSVSLVAPAGPSIFSLESWDFLP